MAEQKEQAAEQSPSQPLPSEDSGDYGVPMMMKEGEKREWPELVGLTAEEAKKRIEEEKGGVRMISVIPPDTFITMDFNQARVRLFIDSQGKVAQTPKIG